MEIQQQKIGVSPLSLSSSPSHDFTFTIPLPKLDPPSAFDLSPADEIFFHGHLLPLQCLPNLQPSPRSSIESSDSFTLPVPEAGDPDFISIDRFHPAFQENGRAKSKSLYLFGIPRWRKGAESGDSSSRQEKQQKQRSKTKFDITSAVKRYMRLIKPLLSFRNRRMNSQLLHRQSYSFSGNLRVRSKKEIRGKRGEFSAPASMRTSPANSGLLVASGAQTPDTASESTMEELKAAIESAIAHCKRSIATEEKISTS